MPHRARLIPDLRIAARFEIRRIHGDHRRHLRASVPFEKLQAERVLERFSNRIAQLLRAHQDVAQRRKLFAGTLARVASAEGGRRQQQRAFVFLDDLADDFRIGRIRVIRDAAAGDQRQPDGHRESERVEERQHADNSIVGAQPEHLHHGFNVRNDVVVRQHHPFGSAGTAA